MLRFKPEVRSGRGLRFDFRYSPASRSATRMRCAPLTPWKAPKARGSPIGGLTKCSFRL